MTDTPAAPVDPTTVTLEQARNMTPEQATAALTAWDAALHPPAPLAPTTPTEAAARLQSLINNPEWGKRLIAGSVEEGREFARLQELAGQADKVKDSINTTTPEPFSIDVTGPGELNRRDFASAVETFRDAGLADDEINQAMHGSKVSKVGRAEYMAVKAARSALLGDKAWCERWSAGGRAEQRVMLRISTSISTFEE